MDVFSIVRTLANLVSGIASNSSHKKTDASLTNIQKSVRLPDALAQAEALYRSDLGTGLPGYETMKADIKSQTPTTLNEAKDYLTGGGMVDALSKLYTQENQNLRNLDVANAGAIKDNKVRYENFLETNKARYQELTDSQRRELELMKVGNAQARTQDNLNFANKGAESTDPMNLISSLLGNANLSSLLGGLLGNSGGSGVSLKPITPTEAGDWDAAVGGSAVKSDSELMRWLAKMTNLNLGIVPKTPSLATFD